jgi:competence protein ComGB
MKFSKRTLKNQHLKMVATSFQRIGRLLDLGYPLDTALEFIQFHVNQKVKGQIEEALLHLREGHPVYEAFNTFDIPSSIKSFLYFYEQQGQLAQGFTQAGMLLHHRDKVISELLKLLRYPLTLLILCGIVLILMFQFVIPHFRTFFAMVTEAPPLFTLIFMQVLYHIPYFLISTLIMFIIIFLFIRFKIKTWSASKKVMFIIKVPFLKKYVQMVISYFFALQLGKLLRTGMTLQRALFQFENQDYLPFLQQECVLIKYELLQGKAFHQILKEKAFLCDELSIVVVNGEKAGYLALDLEHYSDILFDQLEESVQKGLRIIQPMLFLLIGAFVFLLFLATMLPLFQMLGSL